MSRIQNTLYINVCFKTATPQDNIKVKQINELIFTIPHVGKNNYDGIIFFLME
jgi:hypothetical protein